MYKIIVIILSIMFALPPFGTARAQRLNETFLRAAADMRLEQYAEAGQKILSIPAAERTSQMYLTLGESYYLLGNYSDAARAFAIADSMSANPEATLYAARAFAMMLQPANAAEQLQKYLLQREKLSESEIALDPAFAKIEHSKEWRTLWSREWYNASERRHAESTVLLRRNRHTDALAIIDAEIANRATSARFYALRAKVFEAMEQYEAAHESAQAAIRLRNNNPDYFADAANLAARVQRFDIALNNINQAIRFAPYRLELYLQRASIQRMNNRFDEARNDVNFYLAYLPDDAQALYQMGRIETEADNPLSGIEYFTMLIDRNNASTDYYMARANAAIKANNYDLAHHDLSQALDLDPALPGAWHQKGVVLHQEKKLEDACHYWRRALELGGREAAEFIYRFCIR